MTEQQKQETIYNRLWRFNNLYFIVGSDGKPMKFKPNKSQILILEQLND